MVKSDISPSAQKKKWTKSGQNPVIYKDLVDFPGRAIFSLFCENLTLSYNFVTRSQNRFDLQGHSIHEIMSQVGKVKKMLNFCRGVKRWHTQGLDAFNTSHEISWSCFCASTHTYRKVCPCNKLMFRCIEGNRERWEEEEGLTENEGAWRCWEKGNGDCVAASELDAKEQQIIGVVWDRVGKKGQEARAWGGVVWCERSEAGRDLDSIFGFHRCCVYQSLTTAIMIKIVLTNTTYTDDVINPSKFVSLLDHCGFY